MKGAKMYIIMQNKKPVCWEKFKTDYDAKVWCLHNGFAWLKTINEIGDKRIVLYDGIVIEKLY